MHNSTGYVIKQLVHVFSCALSSYGALGKFGEHSRSFFRALQTSRVLHNSIVHAKAWTNCQWVKCSPVSAPLPQPPQGAQLWGAESLQSPTLTCPPTRGSSKALLVQFLYICGSISSTLKRRSLVSVPNLVRSSAVVNLHFFVSKFGKRVELVLFLISFNLKFSLQLEFSDNNRFKAGYAWRPFWRRLIRPFCQYLARSRFKQR